MKRLARHLLSFVAVLAAAGLAPALHAQTPAPTAPLRIGVTPGSLADSVQVAAQEARQQGLDVKVIEFTDWTTPNTALEAGDIDLNYFQHQAFLDNAIRERGYAFVSVATGLLPNIGLYSLKVQRFADLKDGARVGVANDPVNQGRGLLLLEKAGLIQLKAGVGARGSVNDIVANPKKLRFAEIEGPQLVRALDDLDLAQGYPAHYVNAGRPQVAGSALLYSGIDDLAYAIRFVARKDKAQDPRIKRFVKVYQDSPAVRAQISKSFAGNDRLYSLPWLARPAP
ncbi:MetQ/NlpA family ABC transporter substrate-binding protein [Paracidovorax valerianellae]|uniref:D-methionine transport system substrate-binding protein n=1 Tax=Paracidovorax valerianellae TaxID=187868 RepID=A0A1G6S017_9BURK|nr:MetQ/NlpA family ABC transporter substrate-binding protein [Paracidovorax valerianellae]MDA8444123.1 MetQ/NlpA family ABC transporter substrate-binding protein [Paracidovorax valerianellae]SDD09555.1 D-methionine transport system substrate-binding protein [Paracidovorax valerianellae]